MLSRTPEAVLLWDLFMNAVVSLLQSKADLEQCDDMDKNNQHWDYTALYSDCSVFQNTMGAFYHFSLSKTAEDKRRL